MKPHSKHQVEFKDRLEKKNIIETAFREAKRDKSSVGRFYLTRL